MCIRDSSDSVHLAEALLQENLDNTIYKHSLQRKMLLRLHQSMNWFLLDAEINHRLQIPKPRKAFSYFPKLIKKANFISQKIYLRNHLQYQKMVEIGGVQQLKVLDDYIKNTPQDFHY